MKKRSQVEQQSYENFNKKGTRGGQRNYQRKVKAFTAKFIEQGVRGSGKIYVVTSHLFGNVASDLRIKLSMIVGLAAMDQTMLPVTNLSSGI